MSLNKVRSDVAFSLPKESERGYGSLVDWVYKVLRQSIVEGHLPPRFQLKDADLADKLGVSNSPLREAFVRLEQVKLIENIPRRGKFVRSITRKEARDLMLARETIDGLLARLAAGNTTEEGVASLERCLLQAEGMASKNEHIQFINLDVAFHEMVADLAGNIILREIMSVYSDRLALLMHTDIGESRLATGWTEHKNIVGAIKRNKPDEAEHWARRHVRNTLENLCRILPDG